jgi:hypothetical protein
MMIGRPVPAAWRHIPAAWRQICAAAIAAVEVAENGVEKAAHGCLLLNRCRRGRRRLPHVLFFTPRLRKSAKKLARTAAMFAAVGDVTLTASLE